MLRKILQGLKNAILNKQNLFSLLAGLAMVFAYAPFSFWWLAIIALATWCIQINGHSTKQATQSSYFFGLGLFGAGISWVHVSIDQFGGMPLFASLFLMALLCAYLAIFPALSAFIAIKLSSDNRLNIWLLPSTWIATEWLRGWFLTGFPWLSIGYSQIDSPFAYLAPIIGEVGITFILMVIAVSICLVYSRQQLKAALSVIASSLLIVFISSHFIFTLETGETKKVALVQGNIAQELKWQPDNEWPTMLKYLDLTRQNYGADLFIWPESAVPAVEPLAGEFLELANSAAALNNSAIVTGILNYNFETKEYFNGLIVLGKKQLEDTEGSYYYPSSNRFYKHHLLPIGEFVPFQEWLRPIAPLFNLPKSSFSRGNYVQPNIMANGIQLAPLICFEIAFPEQLHANFHDSTDILLTVSNDAWFGTSHGPHQHMEIARMRALEFGRPLLRSTNTGITAAVDHNGKFIEKIPQFEQGVLTTNVPLVEGRTPFSLYQRYPTFIAAIMLILLIIVRKRTQVKL
ncbi:apolipoprotein N-acyltransferase [Thalassotalea sp. M1531]|uniref:Apolipoprotein N-acyltransferase n=1 Tax=Thalassotalea algicola TaxID=2716224 RepID=A0A7Y0LBQ9_9GAMM|nr:apolipoprotein N-acyltransferase [Thalassotalea algicola]NMP31197.1 apolipoprotein N-acyltransferase [Thalassotalea algicola]